MRLVGQPLEGFRLMRTVALGFERLGLSRCGRNAHAWRGPGEVQHHEEPDECEDDQLREKKRRHHGIAPSNRCCDEGILPGFGGNGIIRRVQAHDQSFEAAQDTLVGIELMHMIRKKQMVLEARDEGLTAAELFYSLAA